MKKISYILIYAFLLVAPSVWAGLKEADLEPYKDMLPMKLTPKEIVEWSLEATYKKNNLKLDVSNYKVRLNKKDYRKIEKKGKVRLRIAGDVTVSSSGKKPKKTYKGSANIYIFSTSDPLKRVGKKKLKLTKLCPS